MKITKVLVACLLVSSLILVGCASGKDKATPSTKKEVNVYSTRHYDTDKALYKKFKEETGIEVNVIEGKADELMERLKREGSDTKADVLITSDIANLYAAKEKDLFQPIQSKEIQKNIPTSLTDPDNMWVALTTRARIIAYSKERVKTSDLSTYEDLANAKWKGKILVRSSDSEYNQSLLASLIVEKGEKAAKDWAKSIVGNLARKPEGNDRDQVKAIAAGTGDLALVNTYYIGKMMNSTDAEEVKAAEKVGIFFPNPTHINISGAGITKNAKNKENALKFIEFLTSKTAQDAFANENYEYPANTEVKPSQLLQSWGDFTPQKIDLLKVGENNKRAVEIFMEVGWK